MEEWLRFCTNLPKVSDEDWDAIRRSVAVGDVLSGIVVSTPPFGVFVDVGLPAVGLLDIASYSAAADAIRLPCDRERWPRVGDQIRARVLGFRNEREIALEWLR
jgi:predicted RNA-binding protein (virulence factor B family)